MLFEQTFAVLLVIFLVTRGILMLVFTVLIFFYLNGFPYPFIVYYWSSFLSSVT